MKSKIIVGCGLATVVAAAGGWLWLDYRIHAAVDARLQAAVDSGNYEALEYEDLHFNLKGDVTLDNFYVRQTGLEYILDEVRIRNMDYDNAFPHHMDISVKGLRFPAGLPEPTEDSNDTLQRLLTHVMEGDHIPLELNYTHNYDPDNAWQLDTQTDLKIPALLHLDMGSRMRNLSVESLSALEQQAIADPELMQSQLLPLLQDAEFSSLNLQVTDSGLVQALLEIGAAEIDAPPEDYRTLLISQTRNAYLFLPTTAQTFAQQAGEEVAEFLEGGRTLRLNLEPEFGGHVAQLLPQVTGAIFTGDIGRAVQLLNLELVTE